MAANHVQEAHIRQEGEWVYAKVGDTEMKGRKDPSGIEFQQVSVTYDQDSLQKAVDAITKALHPQQYSTWFGMNLADKEKSAEESNLKAKMDEFGKVIIELRLKIFKWEGWDPNIKVQEGVIPSPKNPYAEAYHRAIGDYLKVLNQWSDLLYKNRKEHVTPIKKEDDRLERLSDEIEELKLKGRLVYAKGALHEGLEPLKAADQGYELKQGNPYKGELDELTSRYKASVEQMQRILQEITDRHLSDSKQYSTTEQLPATKVRYDRSSLESAVDAAKRLGASQDKFVFATGYGYTIDDRPPPPGQAYVIIHADRTTETIKPSFSPQTKARARILWTRESSDERINILKNLGLEKEPYWAQPWDKLPSHYKETIAIHYSATVEEHWQTRAEIIKDYLRKGYHCVGQYKDERVRIESYDRDGFTIFIPSRQESVYVPLDKVSLLRAEREEGVPQTKKRWVTIDNPGDSSFVKDAFVPYEEFEAEREKILQRKGKPPSIKVRIEEPPGNGAKELLQTIQGEPIPEKYRELTPFVDEPLPPGTCDWWMQYKDNRGFPLMPGVRETFGIVPKSHMGEMRTLTPRHRNRLFSLMPSTQEGPQNYFVWEKGHFTAFEYFLDKTLTKWSQKLKVPEPKYIICDCNDLFFAEENVIVIPVDLVRSFNRKDKNCQRLLYFIAHEFCHYIVEIKKMPFSSLNDEERYANKSAEEVSGVLLEDAIVSLHQLVPSLWLSIAGDISFEDGLKRIKDAKAKGEYLALTSIELLASMGTEEKLVPALKPFKPYEFAEFVLRYNRFSDAEVPIYSGLTHRDPLRVPDHIWREVIEVTDGEFVKQGDLNVFHIPEKESPSYMRAAPTWRDITSTIPTNGKKALQVGDRVKSSAWKEVGGLPWLTVKGVYTTTWMGKPMLEVEVTDGITTNRVFEDTIVAHEPALGKPAVIPTKPSRPNPKEELEFVSDSPEFLAYTIEDIGYRDKLDKAFERAIARAKGK